MHPSKIYLIILIILLSIFGPISTDMYLSGLPQMISDLCTDETTITMTLYGFMFSLAISVLFVGPISDKYGRKSLLIFSMALYTIMSILCSMSDNVIMLILSRVLQGIGAAGALSASVALIKDCFTGNDMKNVLTIVAALGIVGPIAAPVIGTALIETIDWRATFWAPAIVSAVCLMMVIAIPETMKDEHRYTGTIMGALKRMTIILKDRDFTVFTVMSSIFYIPFFAYLAVSSYIYQDRFGMSPTEYSIMLAVTALLGVIGMELLQFIAVKVGNRNMLFIFLALGVASCVTMFTIGGIGPLTFMLSILMCAFISMSTRPFGFNILLNQFEGDNGSVSSILNFFTFMLGVVGMIIASLEWESFITGLGFCLLIAVAVYIAMFVLMHLSKTRLKGLEDI